MEEQKRNIFTGNMPKADLGSGVQQEQHLQRMDLPEDARRQAAHVFSGREISAVPGSEISHDPCALRPQSQTSIEDRDGIEGCKTGILSDEMLQTVLKSEFYRDLCVQQVDLDKFRQKYRWRDQLLMVSGQKVSGKGLDDERLRTCYIYLKRGRDRYTLGLAEDAENKEIFYKIPENVAFDIIGKGKEIFVILSINKSEL